MRLKLAFLISAWGLLMCVGTVSAQGITNPGFEACTTEGVGATDWPGVECSVNLSAAEGSWHGWAFLPACRTIVTVPGTNQITFACRSAAPSGRVSVGGVVYEGCNVDSWIYHSLYFNAGSSAQLCLQSLAGDEGLAFDDFSLTVIATATPTPTPTNTPTATPVPPTATPALTATPTPGGTQVGPVLYKQEIDEGQRYIILLLVFIAGVMLLQAMLKVTDWARGR